MDSIKFHSEENFYKYRIDSSIGTGQLNGIPVTIGIMNFFSLFFCGVKYKNKKVWSLENKSIK